MEKQKHQCIKISDILAAKNSKLKSIFKISPAMLKTHCIKMQNDGYIYVPNKGCKNFDKIKGCICNEMEVAQQLINEKIEQDEHSNTL